MLEPKKRISGFGDFRLANQLGISEYARHAGCESGSGTTQETGRSFRQMR